MKILENITLAPYTTFKIGGQARFFCVVSSEEDLLTAVEFARKKNLPILTLGSGSNVLIADCGFPGLVLRMAIKGVEKEEKGDFVLVSAAAGEILDELIKKAVDMGWHGIENLSAIPGTVGASPIQNIAAYGQEIGQAVVSVRALDGETGAFKELSVEDCDFTYRDSLFKKQKGRYFITRVVYKLSKKTKVNIAYKDVKNYFNARKITEPSIGQVRKAIVDIRSGKFPDWTYWGTAGSFFKNPIISAERFNELARKHPDLPHFAEPDGRVKVALGWILDKICDAKGLYVGNVGTYEKQALVIISRPGAKAKEVLDLAKELSKRVKNKTGIDIEGEVEWAC